MVSFKKVNKLLLYNIKKMLYNQADLLVKSPTTEFKKSSK